MEFDATEIANLIKTKQLSPKEAVMNAFSEIKTKNGQLNAVVSLREEKALEEAKRCVDLARPFAGVPILIKSLGQYLEGEPATDGSKLFKDARQLKPIISSRHCSKPGSSSSDSQMRRNSGLPTSQIQNCTVRHAILGTLNFTRAGLQAGPLQQWLQKWFRLLQQATAAAQSEFRHRLPA